MALPNPLSIKVLPSAAYDAGCRASCTISGPEIDGSGNEIYDCSFSATPSTGWRFVDFTWRQSLIVYHKQDGTTTDESFDVSSIENPTDPSTTSARIGVTESRYTRATYDVLNVVANFEPVAPTTYTITTAVSPAGAGSVTGGGQYSSGTTVTLSASPNIGYAVSYWQKDGVTVSGSENRTSLSITVTSNATYTVVFQYVGTVTITIQANDFGLVRFKGQAVDPQQGPIQMEVTKNSSVTMKAFPRYNSEFRYWHILDGSYYYRREITIGATGNWTVHAEFVQVIEAHARLLDNPDATCQFGEVRIVPRNESATAWGQDVRVEIHSSQEVYVQQRSTVVGWALDHFWSKDTSTGSESSVYLQTWSNVYQGLSYGYIVNALFYRTPTHLLVNSFNRSSPVQLVYDPETNKLVADY